MRTNRTVGQELAHVRGRLGSPPRPLGRLLAWRHRRRAPEWLEDGSPLHEAYRDHDLLLAQGQVVWAHLVQANEALFEPGREPYPASILFSLEEAYEDRIVQLGQIAEALFSLKDDEVDSPSLERIVRAVRDEVAVLLNEPVPVDGARGTVYYTSLVVDPRVLPRRRIVLSWFPVLVAPTLTRGSMIVHRSYWSSFLKTFWRASPE